ncbi:MAG: Lrp/AsnC family transcriptional regulator [Leptospiraceae bacterium]|nr:Lrp/AsnC family transcriptional regulator [Leptospiraceae bacterium]MDW8306598.1 Lrp/AsnC family transcriptional regulator [Leptospiraceae bacterium]
MLKVLSKEELELLFALEENSQISNEELSRRLGISEVAVGELKEKLEKEGIIVKYKAVVNWEKIESPEVVALIQVTVTPKSGTGYDEVAEKISALNEVKTCLLVSGSFDLLVEVQGPSLKDVAFLVANKLATLEGVEHTRTNFLLKRYKQGGDILGSSTKTHRLPIVI